MRAFVPIGPSPSRAARCRAPLLLACTLLTASALPAQSTPELPDAPSTLLGYAQTLDYSQTQTPNQPTDPASPAQSRRSAVPPPCRVWRRSAPPTPTGTPSGPKSLCEPENPLRIIVTSPQVPALTPQQKGILAVRDILDPFNLITIAGYSGIVIASNAHTAYGPGFRGFGRLTGYSMMEDAQGEFFGTFLIPVIAHEDPRYHRMPGKPIRRRIAHALLHTFVSLHDDGTPMPNYATLLTYPIDAELDNLYVPGVAVNGPSTAKRIGVGIASNPIGDLVAEFLPDIATRIHIHVIFIQQILQKVAAGPPNMVQ